MLTATIGNFSAENYRDDDFAGTRYATRARFICQDFYLE